jgi:hypothetical protein
MLLDEGNGPLTLPRGGDGGLGRGKSSSNGGEDHNELVMKATTSEEAHKWKASQPRDGQAGRVKHDIRGGSGSKEGCCNTRGRRGSDKGSRAGSSDAWEKQSGGHGAKEGQGGDHGAKGRGGGGVHAGG